MIDVLYITQGGATLPSVRFRVEPFVQTLSSRGYDARWLRLPKTLPKRLAFYATLPRARRIIVQKKLLAGWELSLLSHKAERLLYDFDDAVWTCHPNVEDADERARKEAKWAPRLAATCARVDGVIAGNAYLAAHVGDHARAVHILPTPLDTDRYVPDESAANALPVVGWMGTSSNRYFLPELFSALTPLAQRMRVLVVSDAPYALQGFDYRYEQWTPDNELSLLQSMDIGLMPLTDDPYSRGKCGFKLLQYMACGAVPVASDVGFNREVVQHGHTGYLVGEPTEWAARVAALLDDAPLRARMAHAARADVVARFSLTPAVDSLLHFLQLDTPA